MSEEHTRAAEMVSLPVRIPPREWAARRLPARALYVPRPRGVGEHRLAAGGER
ncbi:hypothetical protein [Streptomyces sp. NBC_01233]|uniref:hypothetical protein n=1 Tax=Streptomyces sp. NBC_01233 TaxID=2903787 RepID=UPI002E16112A|nr:hypothetical protein OG332_27725 [Streptomyces sp. NBC_01233]